MQIYTLSDLHLEPGSTNSSVDQGLQRLCSYIRTYPYGGEDILFIILGDIINQGYTDAFDDAKQCLETLRNQLQDYRVHFEMVPGNHDRINMDISYFDRFASNYGVPISFQYTRAYSKQYAGINFIFADTTWGGSYDEPGHLDINAVQQVIIPDIENVLICHHALTRFYSDSHDCVFNGDRLSQELRKIGIRFVIHGHTHRADMIISDETTTEFGCGSLFKSMDDMPFGSNNQFARIDCQDGQIVSIERIVFTSDGSGTARDELYPQKRSFTDPETIGKLQYAPTEKPHIPRRILPNENAAEDSITRALSDAQSLTLMDALVQKTHVLLLGDAGSGKSIELEELAFTAAKGFHYPFLYHLRDYIKGAIHELLPKPYRELPPERLLLLFDGYDELAEPFRTLFIKELNQYSRNEPRVKIAITSRSNFCKAEHGNKSRTFSSFHVYCICELTPLEQTPYLQERGITPSEFFKAAEQSGVIQLLSSPFYLHGLADIFSQDGILPGKAEVMDQLIRLRFLKDDEKFFDQLAEREYELFSLLQKLSFSMQLMHRQELVAGTEYQRLFTEKERMLMHESGLLERNGDNWRFTHNNFREYLAAKELLSYSFETQLDFIQHDGTIYSSWVNTLGYLCNLEQTGTLLSWLTENAQEALVKFERDRIDPKTKNKVFQSLFSYYESRGLWFKSDLCSERELVQFGSSEDMLQYLIEKIVNPINHISRRIALYMLADSPSLFGMEKVIRNVLLDCCKNTVQNDAYECYLSMRALYRLHIQSDACTEELVKLTRKSLSSDIRLGLYEILLESGKQDKYCDVFIEGIRLINRRLPPSEYRNADEAILLARGLKHMSQAKSVIAVLQTLGKYGGTYFFERKDVIQTLFLTATSLYQAGEQSIFPCMLDCCCRGIETGDQSFLTGSFAFFRQTQTEKRAVIGLISRCDRRRSHFAICVSQTAWLTDAAVELFIEGTLPREHFTMLMEYCSDVMYNKYRQVILERIKLELPERIHQPTYVDERKQQEQAYFSILFDQQAARNLLDDLLSHVGNADITVEELQTVHLSIKSSTALYFLKHALYEYVPGMVKAKDFFEIANWDTFVICEAFHKMYQFGVKPTKMQAEILTALLEETIDIGFIEAALESFEKTQGLTHSTYYTFQLSALLDIPLPRNCLQLLTRLPNDYLSVSHSKELYCYLIKHLGIEALKDRIICDLEEKTVAGEVLMEHIQFCGAVSCDAAVESALEICKDQAYTQNERYESFKYIYERKGAEYVEAALLPVLDTELLCIVAANLTDISRDAMKKAMESQYRDKPNHSLQMYLITFGSMMALEQYANEVQKTHQLPEGKMDYADGPTSAISTIDDPSMLPILGQLLEVACSPDFQDADFGGLRSGIIDAFIRCSERDPDKSMHELITHEKVAAISERNRTTHEYIKEAIVKQQRLRKDHVWTINQVEAYWQAMSDHLPH